MNNLTFNNIDFNSVEQNGQIWLTSSDLAAALGYKTADSVTRIFNRNKDEFSQSMTQTTQAVNSTASLKTKGLRVKTRIFSLRGCHLLAMFARTDIAKAFRVWVLDILDREVKTTASQRTPLRMACDRLAVGNMLISDAYKMVSSRYHVEHIDQIPESKLPEAVAFVYDVILAKQSNQNNDHINVMHTLGATKTKQISHAVCVLQEALATLDVDVRNAVRALDCGIEVVRSNNETQASVFKSLKSHNSNSLV